MEVAIPGIDNLLSGGGGGVLGVIVAYYVMKGKIDDLILWRDKFLVQIDAKHIVYDNTIGDMKIKLATGEQKFEQLTATLNEIKSDLKTLLGRRRNDPNTEPSD